MCKVLTWLYSWQVHGSTRSLMMHLGQLLFGVCVCKQIGVWSEIGLPCLCVFSQVRRQVRVRLPEACVYVCIYICVCVCVAGKLVCILGHKSTPQISISLPRSRVSCWTQMTIQTHHQLWCAYTANVYCRLPGMCAQLKQEHIRAQPLNRAEHHL